MIEDLAILVSSLPPSPNALTAGTLLLPSPITASAAESCAGLPNYATAVTSSRRLIRYVMGMLIVSGSLVSATLSIAMSVAGTKRCHIAAIWESGSLVWIQLGLRPN
ncbi:hypothetical protein MAP00_002336 [Monascus purpureus]|nr:hypothetical protein MAP00_002336 [Monascus purpureus]